MCAMHLCFYEAKWPNLKLKTRLKQLLGYLPLAFALLSRRHGLTLPMQQNRPGQLEVENSAQTTISYNPTKYRAPRFGPLAVV